MTSSHATDPIRHLISFCFCGMVTLHESIGVTSLTKFFFIVSYFRLFLILYIILVSGGGLVPAIGRLFLIFYIILVPGGGLLYYFDYHRIFYFCKFVVQTDNWVMAQS